MDELSRIRKREDLPPLERAVSDTLDEYLVRVHGIISSWADPICFIEWLKDHGCKIVLASKEE